MRHNKWITAAELDNWAGSNDARSALPELIRRLVHATTNPKDLERVNFPGGEEVQRPGYDGETKSKAGNAWVPEGVSCWELGTNEKVKDKLNEDYSKRVAKRGAADFSTVTYIGVTPRDFQQKNEWAEEQKKEGLWGDVRAYDSDTLEQWLETAPAVSLWLAKRLGKRLQGASDISTYWDNMQGVLKRPLPPAIPLISRENTLKRIDDWLSNGAQLLQISAESPKEVVDVFAAWVASLPEERQSAILSRAVVVEDVTSWRELVESPHSLVLVVSDRLSLEPELVAEASRKGHHVLLPAPAIGTNDHRLERINRSKLKEALVAAGVKEAEANILAEHCGGSFSVLKRSFQRPMTAAAPKWGEAAAATELAPLLLLGAWHDASPAEQAIVSKVTGYPYDKVLEILNRWRAEPDSPLRWSNGVWEFVSPVDAWTFLSPKLTRKQLDNFEAVAVEVLCADAPMYELPASERWCAQIHGKFPIYSSVLREALARSLALMAVKSDSSTVADMIPLQARVDRVVRQILPDKAPWQRWASLDSALATLSEASPEAILAAMEADLQEPAPALVSLFAEEGADVGITGRAEHVDLLWALERMAWSPDYLPRVALILAKLAEKDPGGRISNRPAASLRDIFCIWHPHTMTPLEQRLEIIETLVTRHPEVGWQLMLALFPESHASIMLRHTPEWRFWGEDWTPRASPTEQEKGFAAVTKLACSKAEQSPEKWPDIASRLAKFPKEQFLAAVAALAIFAAETTDAGLKRKVWEAVRSLAERHRSFADAEWALPAEALTPLEALRDLLRPTDSADLAAPLFTRRFDVSGDRKLSWDEWQKRQQEARTAAIQAVLTDRGLDAVLTLAVRVEDPRALGMALADASGAAHEGKILPSLLICGDKTLEAVANGYAVARVSSGGVDWIKSLPLAKWKPEEAGLILAHLSFAPTSWDLAKSFGEPIEKAYWKHAPFWFSHGLTAEAVEFAARKLISVARPLSALQLLGTHADDAGCPPSAALLELTQSALIAPVNEGYKIESDVLESIVARLQKNADLDEDKLAGLEWLILPALRWGEGGQPQTLMRQLSRNPDLFIELVCAQYRPKNRDKAADTPPDEGKQLQAQRAQQLLHDWKTIPGTKPDGSIDPAALKEWLKIAREKAKAADRAEVGDILIGHVLAYSPEETDGSWPCVAVKQAIEDINSRDLESGFRTQIFNKRGVFWKAEGGKQERELAERYNKYAVAARTRWPRTAAVLKAVAGRYIAEARREDAESEGKH